MQLNALILKCLKVGAIMLVVVAVAMIAVLILSRMSTITTLRCEGEYFLPETRPGTVHIRIEEYPPIVGLWSDRDGIGWVVGDEWFLKLYLNMGISDINYKFIDKRGDTLAYGGDLSRISNKAFITISESITFIGTCQRLEGV